MGKLVLIQSQEAKDTQLPAGPEKAKLSHHPRCLERQRRRLHAKVDRYKAGDAGKGARPGSVGKALCPLSTRAH